MNLQMTIKTLLTSLLVLITFTLTAQNIKTDVLIIGGGASGTMAGIQAARMGVSTVIFEETQWLGGMLTSAGVSAVDGNYRLHSGLWEEFRQALNEHYGGEEELKTGWVSNVLFEPQVAEKILSRICANEENLKVYRETSLQEINDNENGWTVLAKRQNQSFSINAIIFKNGNIS